MINDDARRAGDILKSLMDRIGATEGSAYVELFSSWREIVGERLADHSEPIDVRGTALVVQADHPGWVQMVMMKRRRIIAEVSRRYPTIPITGLHVRVRGDGAGEPAIGEPGAGEPSSDTAEEPSVTTRPASVSDAQALANIADEELR